MNTTIPPKLPVPLNRMRGRFYCNFANGTSYSDQQRCKESILLFRTGESAAQYLDSVRRALEELEIQQILSAATLVANSLRSGGLIHMFGAGHSLLLAIEVFFRAGGLVAVNPILDRRLQFDGGVIESTEFERTSGAAQEIAREAGFRAGDVGVVASNSGRNVLPVEIAFQMRSAGMKVIAVTNLTQSKAGKSFHASGEMLFEVADAVLDNHCPVGDAAVQIPGISARMGPVSTIAGSALLHAVFIEAAAQLAGEGNAPDVFQSVNVGAGALDDLRTLVAMYGDRIKFYRPPPHKEKAMKS